MLAEPARNRDSAKRFSPLCSFEVDQLFLLRESACRSYAPLAQSPSSKRPTVAWTMLLLSNLILRSEKSRSYLSSVRVPVAILLRDKIGPLDLRRC
jgi:hypothetical protein